MLFTPYLHLILQRQRNPFSSQKKKKIYISQLGTLIDRKMIKFWVLFLVAEAACMFLIVSASSTHGNSLTITSLHSASNSTLVLLHNINIKQLRPMSCYMKETFIWLWTPFLGLHMKPLLLCSN